MWRILLVLPLLLVGCGEATEPSAPVTAAEESRAAAPVLPAGHDWAEVTAPRGGLDRSTADVTVLVMERQCTGARDPRRYLGDPAVIEEDDRVVVSWTSPWPEGASTCPGNPRVERVIHLNEPLGDRELLDGSTWPATPVE